MEKFAERYCSQNKDAFSSADTAYVLAYSVIMLQTDAHNPNIKPEKRMTKEQFISNNRGIDGGKDVDREFLGGIYDRIVSTPISLKVCVLKVFFFMLFICVYSYFINIHDVLI